MTTSIKDPPTAKAPGAGRLTHDVVHEAVGEFGDAAIAAILATEASLEQFEEAAAWAAGESDVMAATRIHPDPVVQAIYDILVANQALDEDRP